MDSHGLAVHGSFFIGYISQWNVPYLLASTVVRASFSKITLSHVWLQLHGNSVFVQLCLRDQYTVFEYHTRTQQKTISGIMVGKWKIQRR